MAQAHANVSELRKLAVDAGIAATELEQRLQKALTKASIAGLATWREAMPIFTGEGVNSILAKGVTKTPGPGGFVYTDLLFATTPQVIVADEGRKPGATPPPLGPIKRWIELKVGRGGFDIDWTGKVGDAAVTTAAIKVAQAIGQRGLPAGRHAAKASRAAKTVLEIELKDAAEDFRRRLS